MAKISFVLCALFPLAWSSVATAAPAGAPDSPAPAGAADRHHGDFAAWHKEMCTDHYARTAGDLGYLQARLDLSDQQTETFNKWRQAVLEQSAKERASCLEAAPKPNAKLTVLDHEAHLEKILNAQLQSVQATLPSLQAFYASLSTEQKSLFDREFHGHGGHHGPHFGPMEGPMPGPMGGPQGPMDKPMDGPMTMEHGQ